MVSRKSKSHKSSSSVSSGDSPSSRDSGSTGSPSPPTRSPVDTKPGSPYQEVHPMLLQYLQGATFHSPPRQAATIHTNNGTQIQVNVPQSVAKTAEGTASDGTALYGTPGDRKTGVGTSLSYASSASSTPSTASLVTPGGSRSNSFSSDSPMGDGRDATAWHGKVEPIPLPLSDAHYLDWLSSTGSSPFQSPDQMQRMETSFPDSVHASPHTGAFATPAGMTQQTRMGAHLPSSVQLPASANTFDIFGTTHDTGYMNGYGFNSPSGAMVELGVSSEGGMDARWMTFVHDCGIMESSNAMQQSC